ncbi:MAG: hypothetical protein N4A47_01755 [Clostridia bacterium]|nr:hypothetical protein [Clostridia bacterium]
MDKEYIRHILSAEFKAKFKKEETIRNINTVNNKKNSATEKLINMFDIKDEKTLEIMRSLKISAGSYYTRDNPWATFLNTENKIVVTLSQKGIDVSDNEIFGELIHAYLKVKCYKDEMNIIRGRLSGGIGSVKRNDLVIKSAINLLAAQEYGKNNENGESVGGRFLYGLECITGKNIAKDIVENNMSSDELREYLTNDLGMESAKQITDLFNQSSNLMLYTDEIDDIMKHLLIDVRGVERQKLSQHMKSYKRHYINKEVNFLDIENEYVNGKYNVIKTKQGEIFVQKRENLKRELLEVDGDMVHLEKYTLEIGKDKLRFLNKETGKELSEEEINDIELMGNLPISKEFVNSCIDYYLDDISKEEKERRLKYLALLYKEKCGTNSYSPSDRALEIKVCLGIYETEKEEFSKVINKMQENILGDYITDYVDENNQHIIGIYEIRREEILTELRDRAEERSPLGIYGQLYIYKDEMNKFIKCEYIKSIGHIIKGLEAEKNANLEEKGKNDKVIEEQSSIKNKIYRGLNENIYVSKVAKIIKTDILKDNTYVYSSEELQDLEEKNAELINRADATIEKVIYLSSITGDIKVKGDNVCVKSQGISPLQHEITDKINEIELNVERRYSGNKQVQRDIEKTS